MKPSIPKGTRDFGPVEMARRNYIFDTIRSVYALYGFQQIETPAMENLSTLMGKYGEEGDKLLFKILNSGDFRSHVSAEEWTGNTLGRLTSLCECPEKWRGFLVFTIMSAKAFFFFSARACPSAEVYVTGIPPL